MARQFRALAAHHILTALELQLKPIQLLCGEGSARAFGPVEVKALWQHNLPDGAFGICGRRDKCEETTLRNHNSACAMTTKGFKIIVLQHKLAIAIQKAIIVYLTHFMRYNASPYPYGPILPSQFEPCRLQFRTVK